MKVITTKVITTSENPAHFVDAGQISPYAEAVLNWAIAQGVIPGNKGILNPKGGAIRCEAATMIMNLCEVLDY